MILKNGSFSQMASLLRESEKKIIIFGAGMIGTVTTPAILEEYGLENRILFYVDNDLSKCGEKVSVKQRNYDVYHADQLKQSDGNGIVVLIAVSRFSDILSQLEGIENLKNTVCHIVPVMCIASFKPGQEIFTHRETQNRIIPKIIHYMWLGGKPIPDTLKYCMDSWQKYCPEYEIRRWDETNYDIEKNEYMKQAYEQRMFGFIPDYARLDILYRFGGIYFDTDVELVRNIDDLLYQNAFCCVEKWQTINFGGGSGAVKGNKAIEELLKARENLTFVDRMGNCNKNTCGYYDTRTFQKFGYQMNGKKQRVLDINIYPYEVFHPYDYMSGRIEKTGNTYGIHHFNGGWLDQTMKEANRRTSEEFEKVYSI